MKNMFKNAKTFIYLLLTVTLIFNFISWRYPLNYLSFRTGYKVESIRNFSEYNSGQLSFSQSEYEQICKSLNPNKVFEAIGEMYKISILLTGFSLMAIVFFALSLRFSKQNTFRLSNKLAILYMSMLFLAFLMLGLETLPEIELDFLNACSQFYGKIEF